MHSFHLQKKNWRFLFVLKKGEEDIPVIFAKPDDNVVRALTGSDNLEELWANLPMELSSEY